MSGNMWSHGFRGKKFATCVATPSGPATVTIKLPFDPTIMGILANDKVGIEFEYFVEALDDSEILLTNLMGRLDLYKTGAGRLIYEQTYNSAMGFAKKISGKISKQLLIPESSASLTNASSFQLTITTSELKPLKIGISNPKFIKL